jgi:hypothetical protein
VAATRGMLALALAVLVPIGGLTACGGEEKTGDAPGAAAAAAEAPSRVFGVATDPWKVDEWAAAVGEKPTMVMEFEAWTRNRTIDNHFAEVRRQGIQTFMLTWEPWKTVSAAKGKTAQYTEQPEFSNAAIAAGKKDEYIKAWAESIAKSGLKVYVRYAHEMNGDWYPWSRDPANYVAAWRRMVDIFRAAGAENAKFVFSINPSVFEPEAGWEANLRKYWPGDDYVDLLGSTMISFGGKKDYGVGEFVKRFEKARTMFGKKLIITELNTAAEGRVKWLVDLRTWLATTGASWVEGIVLSQAESRGAAQLGNKVGNLSWNVTSDPETQPIVRGIIKDLQAAPAG